MILNFLVNAMQAVEATNRHEGGRIVISSERRGDMVAITFEDNGGGIPKENIPKLFDPFFTTKVVGEGTGLGLSISHGIITGHGGRIEVESEEGVGTKFTVLLPQHAAHGPVTHNVQPDNMAGPVPGDG